mmetsp:Transcript_32258/g.36587  ORF Transcript_32258/g.36587 Transcript_32258/m.36587 type:complete len:84 (+) Transcript_32258:69-320(+)
MSSLAKVFDFGEFIPLTKMFTFMCGGVDHVCDDLERMAFNHIFGSCFLIPGSGLSFGNFFFITSPLSDLRWAARSNNRLSELL